MPIATVHDVLELARQLSPSDKLKVIQQLRPDIDAEAQSLDDQYQRGYEKLPEDPSDAESLLAHLPLSEERGE